MSCTSNRPAAEAISTRPGRSGRVFSCPFVSESCPAPGLEDRAKRTGRRAARASILEKRPNLAELEALGHGNRARDRRETAFCATKSRQQRAEPVPVQLAVSSRPSRSRSKSSSGPSIPGPRARAARAAHRPPRHWAPGSDPPASVPVSLFQMPGSSIWHRDPSSGAPGYRVILLAKTTICRDSWAADPGVCQRVHAPCF